MEHAWCHDVARDAAVRAAEDHRMGPLPTLEEAIAMIPKTGSSSSGVEHENKGDGMATNGLRTERVTLEVTVDMRRLFFPGQWHNALRESGALMPGESVRVVEETHFDDLAQVAMQRDAAIRERDSLCEQLESVACRAATAETALEAASGGGEGEPVAWMCEWTDCTRFFGSKTKAERAAGDDVVPQPLYRAHPQPRGWLTEDERSALDAARTILSQYGRTNIGITIDGLLARSLPPEVVLPRVYCHGGDGEKLVDIKDVRAAIAAAGVALKEVGRE